MIAAPYARVSANSGPEAREPLVEVVDRLRRAKPKAAGLLEQAEE